MGVWGWWWWSNHGVRSGGGGGRGSADVNQEFKVFTLQEMCCGFLLSREN